MGVAQPELTMSSRYLTSDPTQSLALTRDGRPYMDFAAAPSLFLEEDIRQENLLLARRQKVCDDLKTSEINEAQTVAARTEAERFAEAKIAEERAAAARAAEAREIEVRAVEQRSAIEAAYSDAEMQARAAIPAPRSSARCCRAPVPSRSVLPRSASRLPRPQRRLLPLPAAPRQPLLRLAVHKTVPTASASHSRPRLTELHQSIPPYLAVVATSWIKHLFVLRCNLALELVCNIEVCAPVVVVSAAWQKKGLAIFIKNGMRDK